MVTTVAPDEQRITRSPMSYEAYLALPDNPAIVEWAKGEVLFHVPPSLNHQSIALFLAWLIGAYAKLTIQGSVVAAPFEVRLSADGPSREPDVLYVGDDNLAQPGPQRMDGVPDLIIEVVSPSSLTHDRITKFREYEQAGVREYWIIDPRPHQQQADFYVRDEAGHFVPAEVSDDGVYASHVVAGFKLRVAWLWETPLPDNQRVLAEIMVDAPGVSDELRAVYREMLRILKP